MELPPEASHHLLRVLRASPGEVVQLFDGSGLQVEARLVQIDGSLAIVEVITAPVDMAPDREVHLLLGMPKKGAPETAPRMATKRGVTHIHPFLAARSVADKDKRQRWLRVVSSAAQQCGRADTPFVGDLSSLASVLAEVPEASARWVMVPGAERHPPTSTASAAVVIGPEGGLSEQEVNQVLAAGFRPMGLAQFVLRVDTAVAAALTSI
jgi:16S rRNA (uracil1498-N3)-methyltransferase